MKIEKINNNQENLIIISLIVSDKFCQEVIPIIEINLFRVNFVKIVARWIIDYFNQYNKAPKKDIQKIYEENVEKSDPDLMELVEDFLVNLNENYEREQGYNEDYAIDQAIKYLKIRKLKELKKDIDMALKTEQVNEAENLIETYSKIEKNEIETIDIFEDDKKIIEALEQEDEILYKLPGALGDLFGNFLRGDLVAFAAPSKRAKSFWLVEMAIKSLLYGFRVLFFSFEMTKTQMIKRIFQNITAEIKKNNEKKINIPRFVWDKDVNKYKIEYIEIEKKGLNVKDAIKKKNQIKEMIKKGELKLVCQPPDSMKIKDMGNHADNLYKKKGFVADIWIIDYADIILSNFKGEYRHQIDDKWKGMKNIALDKHVLIFTATHTNKTTYKKDVEQGDMSEDIRKMNHVSVMIGLNQSKEEKKAGIMRLQTLAHRHEHFTMDDVIVLQNLDISKPFLDAKHKDEVDLEFMKREKNW